MEIRICKRCGGIKTEAEFYKSRRLICKDCHIAQCEAYNRTEHGRETQMRYRERHRARIRATGRKYQAAHRPEKAAFQREYYQRHRERILQRIKTYRDGLRQAKIDAGEIVRGRGRPRVM